MFPPVVVLKGFSGIDLRGSEFMWNSVFCSNYYDISAKYAFVLGVMNVLTVWSKNQSAGLTLGNWTFVIACDVFLKKETFFPYSILKWFYPICLTLFIYVGPDLYYVASDDKHYHAEIDFN